MLKINNQFPDIQIHCMQLDVRSRQQVNDCITGLPPDFKDIDVLCNNAGLSLGLDPAQNADIDDWEQMIDTNIKGLCYMTKAVLSGMVRRNRGHIVNMGSVAGTWPYPGGNTYGATKAVVKQFTNNLLLGKRVTHDGIGQPVT